VVRARLAPGAPLLGIGVGLSGVVNPQRALIRYSIPLRIEEPWDFQETVANGYDLPVFIENDANACAWGELAFQRSKRLRDFVFVLSEFRDVNGPRRPHERIGVGMGLAIGGRVHHGRAYSAGEFRSVLCTPENTGQFSLSEEDSLRVVDDPQVFARFLRELARNVAMLVNTLNLEHVFLGGDIERFRERVAPVMSEEIQRNWPYADQVQCRVAFSSMGEKAVAYGAAGLVLQRLFGDLPGRSPRVAPVRGLIRAGAHAGGVNGGFGRPLSGETPDEREKSAQGGVS
jgi:predicted NBD/HSP70 family sugar kinase